MMAAPSRKLKPGRALAAGARLPLPVLSAGEVGAALAMWGEFHRSGAARDVAYSARAGAAGRWARRIDGVLPLMDGRLRLVLRQRYVEGLTAAQACQDVRVPRSADRWHRQLERARAVVGRLLVGR